MNQTTFFNKPIVTGFRLLTVMIGQSTQQSCRPQLGAANGCLCSVPSQLGRPRCVPNRTAAGGPHDVTVRRCLPRSGGVTLAIRPVYRPAIHSPSGVDHFRRVSPSCPRNAKYWPSAMRRPARRDAFLGIMRLSIECYLLCT